MGFLDIFRQPKTPMVTTILPDAARQEILRGRLPILRTNKIFLKSGEQCHYFDKAIYKKNKSIIKIITTNVFLILDFIFSFVGATYVSLNSNTEYSLDSFFSSKDQNEFDKDIIKYNTYQIMKSFEIL